MKGRIYHCVVSALVAVFSWGQGLDPAPKRVVINEFMASNSRTLADAGVFEDWIELYNSSSQPVDVGGMYLTDDLGDPAKWQLPQGQPLLTTIPPGGYLLIWADGDIQAPGLHAGFNLAADGEEIGLFAGDGTLSDGVLFDKQLSDVSYGRWADGNDTWQYMATPTPGGTNKEGLLDVVTEVDVNPVRGFYNTAIDVTLTTETQEAEIWYTLDANIPHRSYVDSRGRIRWIGQRYTGPIQVSRTTCLRTMAIKPGWKDSSLASHTYLFLDDVIRQPSNPVGFPTSWGGRRVDYAMDPRVVNDPAYSNEIKDDLKSTPSVCIVIPNADLFGSGGIYANPTAKGDLWERAASMEWIDPNTGDPFGVNAGLRIQGGDYSRARASNPKSGLQFFFRGKYGLSKLEYPLFPDTEVKAFNRFGLREIWNYSWIGDSGGYGADYLRDVFARDTVRDLGRLTPYGRPVQVYINGLYWGLYIMTERVDEDFMTDHLGGDKEDYDVLEAPSNMGGGTTMKVLSGGEKATQAWNTLFSLADAGLASPQAYQAIQEYVDVPALIDYMLMIYYTGSQDAPVFLGDQYTPRNFYAVRRREPASPFLFLPWDVEWALEYAGENRVGIVGVWNPHYLMNRLAANPDFLMLLADHIHRQFHNGGALTRESATARYTARANEIHGAIVGESARWGDVLRSSPGTRMEWQGEVNRLVTEYFSGRTETVLAQLRDQGWYPSVEAPTFQINGSYQHGGAIQSNDPLSMTALEGRIYYTLDGCPILVCLKPPLPRTRTSSWLGKTHPSGSSFQPARSVTHGEAARPLMTRSGMRSPAVPVASVTIGIPSAAETTAPPSAGTSRPRCTARMAPVTSASPLTSMPPTSTASAP